MSGLAIPLLVLAVVFVGRWAVKRFLSGVSKWLGLLFVLAPSFAFAQGETLPTDSERLDLLIFIGGAILGLLTMQQVLSRWRL